MADSDNTTTLPFVIGQQRDEFERPGPQATDATLSLWSEWRRARYASLLLCRIQQRMEARMIAIIEADSNAIDRPLVGAGFLRDAPVTLFRDLLPVSEIASRDFAVIRMGEEPIGNG